MHVHVLQNAVSLCQILKLKLCYLKGSNHHYWYALKWSTMYAISANCGTNSIAYLLMLLALNFLFPEFDHNSH